MEEIGKVIEIEVTIEGLKSSLSRVIGEKNVTHAKSGTNFTDDFGNKTSWCLEEEIEKVIETGMRLASILALALMQWVPREVYSLCGMKIILRGMDFGEESCFFLQRLCHVDREREERAVEFHYQHYKLLSNSLVHKVDFNTVCLTSEKIGVSCNMVSIRNFNLFILHAKLVDLLMNGSAFTWTNSRDKAPWARPSLKDASCKKLSPLDREMLEGEDFSGAEINISHLQFADYTMLFINQKVEFLINVKRILRCFELAFGLKINFHKSSIMRVCKKASQDHSWAAALRCKEIALPTEKTGSSDPPDSYGSKFNIDGSARCKPGAAGIGGVLRDNMGKVLCLFSLFAGFRDSNEVKLMAIENVAHLCSYKSSLFGREINIISDSKVAVSWINDDGFGSLTHVDRVYDTHSYLGVLGGTIVSYSSRASNSFTDNLAKLGSSIAGDFIQWGDM
ncbi:hypothetical protein Dsin_008303 [Dipteronia sinensis]|uniref:RNase H type-1 domain-containing protein n=1 Tax=Dipteronia sinensis TaxID=43782 RepID=A0AAE0ANF6_9ROSI|nr:hypothetical protein Dsin_008303 [Dipteronia sinensis]